jgi:hypothetical protein
MTELLLCGALVAHAVWVHYNHRQIRRDLLLTTKNPRQARTSLMSNRAYKNLDK